MPLNLTKMTNSYFNDKAAATDRSVSSSHRKANLTSLNLQVKNIIQAGAANGRASANSRSSKQLN